MSTIGFGIFQTVSVLSTGHTRRFNALNMRGHCTSIIKIIILLSFKRWQMPTTTLLCSILVIKDVTVMALFSENLLLVKISRTTVWIYHHPNHFQIRIKSFPSYFWLMKLTHCVKILSLPTHGGHCPIQVEYLMQDFQGLVNRWNVPLALRKKKLKYCTDQFAVQLSGQLSLYKLHMSYTISLDNVTVYHCKQTQKMLSTITSPVLGLLPTVEGTLFVTGFETTSMTSEGSVPWVTAKYAV